MGLITDLKLTFRSGRFDASALAFRSVVSVMGGPNAIRKCPFYSRVLRQKPT